MALHEWGRDGPLHPGHLLRRLIGLGVGFLLPAIKPSATPSRGFGYDCRWTALLASNCFLVAYFGGIAAYLPLALAQPGAPNAGFYFTADAIGVLLLRTPSGALVDRFGARPGQLLGVAVTLVGLGILALPPTTVTLFASGITTGLGRGSSITGVLVALAQRSGDHNRGTAMAMSAASLNAGLLLGSALAGSSTPGTASARSSSSAPSPLSPSSPSSSRIASRPTGSGLMRVVAPSADPCCFALYALRRLR